ncbi:MAG: acetate--CoA ligase family protein [Acetobacterales bacterium]
MDKPAPNRLYDPRLEQALFNPRRIVLVGASADPRKNSGRAQRYLRKHGYDGEIMPVNPGREEIDGERCYPDIDAIEGEIDHAYILLGTDQIEEQVERLSARGVPIATILADGFADAGPEGQARQDRIVAAARGGGMRLLGPNCMGGVNVTDKVALCVNAALDTDRLIPGPLGLLSHSGSIVGTLLSRGQARGIGFSKMIGTGNECDLKVGEIGHMLVDDPATKAILMFLETIRDPGDIAAMARRAHEAGKPVIAYKLGRSEAGSELATSHTGALAGSDESTDAFFRHNGIVRVDMLESLFEAPFLLMNSTPPTGGKRTVSVMTTTGGGGAMVVDQLGLRDVEAVPPTDAMIEALGEKGINVGHSRLTDLTLAGARQEIVDATLTELLATDHTVAAVPVIGSSAQFKPELAVAGILSAHEKRKGDKPLAVFLVPQADESLRLLSQAGIAAFRTPETIADSLNAFLSWRAPTRPEAPAADNLDAAVAAMRKAAAPVLDERAAGTVFAALGIGQPKAAVLTDLENFEDIPDDLEYPVVAKIVSPDIAHKTEAGGVVLNVPDRLALQVAGRQIVRTVREREPEARLQGVLVQRMEKGLAEAIVGYRVDPQVGPIVLLGLGGVLAEIYRDFAIRIAPVTVAEARQMIEEVKGLAPIRGFRGMQKGDLDALAQAIARLSDLARVDSPSVVEAEINPVLVRPAGQGVVAVDGLIVCKQD